MICSRCGNLIVEDRFMDWSARWRCLKCSHVEDSASVQSYLEHHKKVSFFNKLSSNGPEPNYHDTEVHLGSESFVGPHITFPRPAVIRSNSAIRRNSKLS